MTLQLIKARYIGRRIVEEEQQGKNVLNMENVS